MADCWSALGQSTAYTSQVVAADADVEADVAEVDVAAGAVDAEVVADVNDDPSRT